MDSIVLPYRSGEHLVLKAPKALGVSVRDPKEGGLRARKHLFKEALGTGFADFLRSASRVLIIINDSTRPTPTKEMMSALLPYVEEAGIQDDQLTILIATGAHRPALESEFEQLLGRGLARRLNNRIVSHVATDRSR
ncbi:MAG TPA: lactate racemase domain-containing protein, partial [Sphaerochaeta sp.]|nr:lactate racemase domain-containing protein [Sphaerochaeta sp.]